MKFCSRKLNFSSLHCITQKTQPIHLNTLSLNISEEEVIKSFDNDDQVKIP